MSGKLADRVRGIRSRAAVRAWQYRQRRHAHGVWFRLRRLLAFAKRAYEISEEESRLLLSEGYPSEPAGFEIEPPKLVVNVPEKRLARLASAKEMPLRLGPEFFSARFIALAPFEVSD